MNTNIDKDKNRQQQIINQAFHVGGNIQDKSKKQKIRMYEIDKIKDYYEIAKPRLSQIQRQIIQSKLDLQKNALRHAQDRIKQDDYFVHYQYNPFLEKQNNTYNQAANKIDLYENKSGKKLNRSKSNISRPMHLIQAINTIKQKQFPYLFTEFNEKKSEYKKSSSNFLQKSNKPIHRYQKKQDIKKKIIIQQKQLSFDDIINISQKNYYITNRKEINLFQFRPSKYSNSILCNDILDKHYFAFNSNVDKLNKFKFPIYRDMSKLARHLIIKNDIPRNTVLEMLTSKQLTFTPRAIKFEDMISVCSGRIDADLVYKVLNEQDAQKDNSGNSSIEDAEDPIQYLDNQKHELISCDIQSNNKLESMHYLRMEMSNEQNHYYKKYNKIYKNVKNNIDNVDEILKRTIKDRKTHDYYKVLIANDLSYLIDLDQKKLLHRNEKQKLIRSNKIQKNRQQRLKIRQLLNTIKINNRYQQKINELFSKGNQSK